MAVNAVANPAATPISAAITIARLICILGVVYVHGWTGLHGDELAAQAGSAQGVMRWTLVELFGRSAVPLLSILSGWLVARSPRRRSYGAFVSEKARALLAPMAAWNAIGLVLVVGAGMLGWIEAPRPASVGWVVDELFCITRPADVGVQMSFLRDLFLCMLAAPWLVRISSGRLFGVALIAAVWVIGGWAVPILLRPSILLFFACGILAARHGVAERIAALPIGAAIWPFLLVLPLKLALSIWGDRLAAGGHMVAAVDLGMRFAAATAVWRLSILLASRPVGMSMLRLAPYSFLLFCSHVVVMWLLGPLLGLATGPMGHPAWPFYFLLQPLLALGFAIALGNGLAALSPGVARMLSGGRLGKGVGEGAVERLTARPDSKFRQV
jgi:fucose 4-O-acetylase-like acetyltransferase